MKIMNKIFFGDFMIKRNQKLNNLLSVFSASNNEHLIHKIRVEIKKINALIRLFQFNKKKLVNKKTIRELHELFQDVGRIRSSQVELKKLKLYYPKFNLSAYTNLIEKNRKKDEIDLYKKIKGARFNLKVSQHSTSELSLNQIASFLVYCYKNSTKPKFNSSHIHDIRCKLKDAVYIVDFIKSAFYTQIGSKQKKLIQRIGRWHDLVYIKKNMIDENKKNRKNMIYNNLDMVIKNLNERISNEKRNIKSVL
jgi:hypothetical protein